VGLILYEVTAFSSIYLILLANSASNRNGYQENLPGAGDEVQPAYKAVTTSSPSVSRLSRKCGMFDISQSSRPPRPVTGIALLYSTFMLCLKSYIIYFCRAGNIIFHIYC
jgi:hypothetical protein